MGPTLGAEGDAAAELRDRPADRGSDAGPVDGAFGRRTASSRRVANERGRRS
ncbi:hypothetical protein [Haloplanus salinus]|uniref:hypothetical protein n=1 Tax=Haloplanus salinus TaxID=1126245 RepID=UPI0015F04B2D|nr:hypothetical protein [Haloplanus salinus]